MNHYFEGKENMSLEELKSYKDKLIAENPDDLISISIGFQEFLENKKFSKNHKEIDIKILAVGVGRSKTSLLQYLAKVHDNTMDIVRIDESSIIDLESDNMNSMIEFKSSSNGKIQVII